MPAATFKDLVLDANDPAMLGHFWADTLGLASESLDDGDVVLRGITATNAMDQPSC
jgi:hypothetical protein